MLTNYINMWLKSSSEYGRECNRFAIEDLSWWKGPVRFREYMHPAAEMPSMPYLGWPRIGTDPPHVYKFQKPYLKKDDQKDNKGKGKEVYKERDDEWSRYHPRYFFMLGSHSGPPVGYLYATSPESFVQKVDERFYGGPYRDDGESSGGDGEPSGGDGEHWCLFSSDLFQFLPSCQRCTTETCCS